MSKVLVTGGSGFIAGHCIKLLLERGYNVVTTARTPSKAQKVLDAFNAPKNALSYVVVEDVAQKSAFDEAIKSTPDLHYVIHTTSPFHYNVQDPVKDFLEPAVNGTTNILGAVHAHAPTVKRIVLLSSFAAINHGSKATPPFYDETSWNPITWDEAANDKSATYRGSKTLAEKAAWEFMQKEKPGFDITTINPSLVFGPAAPSLAHGELQSLNTSNMRILDMIQGKMKEKLDPTGFYTWVDVRDVALAHVRALEVPEAGNQRFLLLEDYITNPRIARIIASMGDRFAKMLPGDLDSLPDDIPPKGQRYEFSNKKSRDVLGIRYTDLETSVKDTVESLVGLANPTPDYSAKPYAQTLPVP